MSFLDNQEEFNITFGFSPTILLSNPMSPDYLSTQKLQREYGEKYKLDIFMYLYKLNYVGHVMIDTSLNVQEVGR